jgi:hypothetical protein
LAHLAARVVLWAALGLGCVGGVVGLVRATADPAPAPGPPSSGGGMDIPGPVASTAELVVERWLTATPDDAARLTDLFVEPPELQGLTSSSGDLTVERVRAIAGQMRQENYWSVTVAADVIAPDITAEDPGAEPAVTTWYLEVGIAGDSNGRMAALAAPAVVPHPPRVSTGWRASVGPTIVPRAGDPTAAAVEGFLDALLAGSGDPRRYVATGVDVTPLVPAPFSDVVVDKLAIDELPDGAHRVLAQVTATTPGGARLQLAYEVVVVERPDRLEVAGWSGAPAYLAGSANAPDEPGDQREEMG